MALKPICGITAQEAIADLVGPPPPRGVPNARWNRKLMGGEPHLAWYRGHQAGVHDAVLTIQKRYPGVAKQLREAFEMREDGAIEL